MTPAGRTASNSGSSTWSATPVPSAFALRASLSSDLITVTPSALSTTAGGLVERNLPDRVYSERWSMTTFSRIMSPVTFSPSAVIVPENSWPRVMGFSSWESACGCPAAGIKIGPSKYSCRSCGGYRRSGGGVDELAYGRSGTLRRTGTEKRRRRLGRENESSGTVGRGHQRLDPLPIDSGNAASEVTVVQRARRVDPNGAAPIAGIRRVDP